MLEILQKIKTLIYYWRNMPQLYEAVDTLKSRYDLNDELFLEFQRDRTSKSYMEVYDKASPLISCCIATYNRGNLLIERSLKSLLNQTYDNLEIIVIGDEISRTRCPSSGSGEGDASAASILASTNRSEAVRDPIKPSP